MPLVFVEIGVARAAVERPASKADGGLTVDVVGADGNVGGDVGHEVVDAAGSISAWRWEKRRQMPSWNRARDPDRLAPDGATRVAATTEL